MYFEQTSTTVLFVLVRNRRSICFSLFNREFISNTAVILYDYYSINDLSLYLSDECSFSKRLGHNLVPGSLASETLELLLTQ